jgi:hypothetical protein
LLQVEKAKDFSDPTKPRSWSKYSSDSSKFQKNQKEANDKQSDDLKVNDKFVELSQNVVIAIWVSWLMGDIELFINI